MAKYELQGNARFSRLEKGKVVNYKPGSVVELSDEEAANFAPGRIAKSQRKQSEPDAVPAAKASTTATPTTAEKK